MELEELKNKIKEFDKKAGLDKTEISDLIKMLNKEVKIIKSNSDKKSAVNHQLTDLLILIMQIANRNNTDFEKELSKWFTKSKKYIYK